MKIDTGYFCEKNIVQVVLPETERYIDETQTWKIIGWAGVDGIQFRQKLDTEDEAIFAYYPIETEYIQKADSIQDLIQKWLADEISV